MGPPEIRELDDHWACFSPWANLAPVKEPPGNKPPAEKDPPPKERPVKEPKQIGVQCEQEPQPDEVERFLVLLFRRRNVPLSQPSLKGLALAD